MTEEPPEEWVFLVDAHAGEVILKLKSAEFAGYHIPFSDTANLGACRG